MSGHSKWSTIKRKKGANDAARAKVFTKILIRIIDSRRVRLIGIAWLIDIVRAIRVVWAVGIRIIWGVRISWLVVRIVFDMNNGVVC